MHRSSAIGLVLSYFAASCANREAPAPIAAPPATVSSASSAPTTPPPSDAAPPPADVADAAIAVADAGKPKRKFPSKCFKDEDCGPDAYCVLNFNGANFEKGPGHCSTEPPIYEGRPLMVDGEAHVATSARSLSALQEHASIAAFARTIASLIALGAPRHLIEKSSAALHDEIRHAADAWSDGGPGLLPAAIAPFPSFATLAADLVVDVFRGGCLGETRAAERALARAREGGPDAALHQRIAEDEARHAALAFETAIWLADRFPDARAALDAEVAACVDDELAPLLALLRQGDTMSPNVHSIGMREDL
jgi:hypothetical protein